MTIRAWVQCVGKGAALADIQRGLVSGGVELQGFDPFAVGHYGVLLLDDYQPGVCELLGDLGPGCRDRVLAGVCERLTPEQARHLLRDGVADVLHCDGCLRSVDEILARLRRWEAVDALLAAPEVGADLIGPSAVWQRLLRQVVEVAHFTDAPMLILGESGTGKEGIARLVHRLDARAHKPDLVVLDCSTIVPELSGSEFFGHERGAFTGASSPRDGAFAQADRGTLFLDEVGELPLHLQTQLLRVIQEQSFKRVGGSTWQRTAFRLVAATNRELQSLAQRGAFRADLYFRLAGFVCRLPPLRERPEDILPLAEHFLRQHQHRAPARDSPTFDPVVQAYLLQRDYPGNVRDLRQVVARLLARYPGVGPITVGCIPPDERLAWFDDDLPWDGATFVASIHQALHQGLGLKAISRAAEDAAIRDAIAMANGNLQQAAARLGVTDRTLQLRRAARRQAPSGAAHGTAPTAVPLTGASPLCEGCQSLVS